MLSLSRPIRSVPPAMISAWPPASAAEASAKVFALVWLKFFIFSLLLCLPQCSENLVRRSRWVNPFASGILNGADDDMGVSHGVADAARAVGGIASSRFQQIHFRWSDVENGGFLVVEHVAAEPYAGGLIPHDFFAELTAFAEHHDLLNLAFQRSAAQDFAGIADHAMKQHLHVAGFCIDRHFAENGIHDVELPSHACAPRGGRRPAI